MHNPGRKLPLQMLWPAASDGSRSSLNDPFQMQSTKTTPWCAYLKCFLGQVEHLSRQHEYNFRNRYLIFETRQQSSVGFSTQLNVGEFNDT